MNDQDDRAFGLPVMCFQYKTALQNNTHASPKIYSSETQPEFGFHAMLGTELRAPGIIFPQSTEETAARK